MQSDCFTAKFVIHVTGSHTHIAMCGSTVYSSGFMCVRKQ